MKLFPLLAAAALTIGATPALAEVTTYKFKQSGDGWRGRPWVGTVVEVDGSTVRPRHTEQTSAFSAIVGSWADYPAIAIRACKGAKDSFDAADCITVKGPEIVLPADADIKDYSFEFKYRFGDSVRQDSFTF